MILKKPYAFFIKCFKLFHLIMFGLGVVLLYKTSLIYDFLKTFAKTNPNVIGKNLVSPLYSWWLYLLIIIFILINVLIIVVLVRKDKPIMYYIINIVVYVVLLAMYSISNGMISNLQVMLVPARTVLAVRDLMNLMRMFQSVSIVFYLIRATGFDIKKFDFVRDLQSLDISEEDSEEIEVAIEFEGNAIIRNIKKNYRNLKYYYKENKFIINIISLSLIGVILLIIYFSFDKYDKLYKENQFIGVDKFNIGVKDSFIVVKSYNNKLLFDDSSALVVVRLSSSSKYGIALPSSRVSLVINGTSYYHNESYASSLIDLGNVYNGQIINKDFSDYLFAFKVPTKLLSSEMKLRYIDNIKYKHGKTKTDSINIKLNPTNIDTVPFVSYNYAIENDVDLSFGDYSVTVDNYELSDKFIVSYNACVNNECYDLKEVLKPSLRNHDKVLLKLNGRIKYTNEIGKVVNLFSLVKMFGSIDYVYNGNSYSESGDFNLVSSSKSTVASDYYIEVDREILDASEIKLSFNFRNGKYSYVLRGDINE